MGARALHAAAAMARCCPSGVQLDYVGRQLPRPPGEGYSAAHKREQERIVRVALDLEDGPASSRTARLSAR